jgi:hypothetical protein
MKNLFLLLSLVALVSCDPCRDTNCLNGGFCDNGSCDCPPQYTGAICDRQVKPSKIRINSVRLLKYPVTESNGQSWDFSSGADVYWTLSMGGSAVFTSGLINDVSGQELTYTSGMPFDINDVNGIAGISIYDYDDIGADDFMGFVSTTFYSDANGFPNVLTLETSNLKFQFFVEYIF